MMKILEHTKEQSPTYMRDVITNMVGHRVTVYLDTHVVTGKLETFNHYVLHIKEGRENFYIHDAHVQVIKTDWENDG
jgi:hypothetical protein